MVGSRAYVLRLGVVAVVLSGLLLVVGAASGSPASTATYTLTVSKAGLGSGGVMSSPAGIDCGSTCSAQFAAGTQVTLTAVAAPVYIFGGWSGGGCSGVGTCQVTMNADAAVTATFPGYRPLIEYWDGTSWTQQAIPSPTDAHDLGAVTAISPTDAWAFGTQPRGVLAVHWDGSSWKQVAMPTLSKEGRADEIYDAAAISATDVWAVGVGYPTHGIGIARNLVEHWDGRAWRIVPSPTAGFAGGLVGVAALSSRNVWAVGRYSLVRRHVSFRTAILHWNGRAWKRVASPHPGSGQSSLLTAVTVVSARSAWAVGSYLPGAGESRHQLILHWNGKQWRKVHTSSVADRKIRTLTAVAAVGRNNVWAVGYDTKRDLISGHLPRVEHWNGHSWQMVAASGGCASPWQRLTDLVTLAAHDIWAVGMSSSPCQAGQPGATRTQALAKHWDGNSWSSSSMSPAGYDNKLSGIDAASRRAIWAVGWSYG